MFIGLEYIRLFKLQREATVQLGLVCSAACYSLSMKQGPNGHGIISEEVMLSKVPRYQQQRPLGAAVGRLVGGAE